MRSESEPPERARQLAELEHLLSLCEVQAVRFGLPFPLGAHARGDGVNFAIFSRHATGVRLDLFDHSNAAVPVRSIILNGARNKTGDIWHVWLEGIRSGQLYGFRIAGPYDPCGGHRFNPDKLLVDPYATAITSVADCDFQPALGYDPVSPRKDLSMSEVDSAAVAPKCIVTLEDFDWQGDQPLLHSWESTVIDVLHVRGYTIHRTAGEDPILRDAKLIAEAWGAAGAYQVGSFSHRRWAEWNGHFRDDVRRFWRGDEGMVGRFASRICGSSDLYSGSGKGAECSIKARGAAQCGFGAGLRQIQEEGDQRRYNEFLGKEPQPVTKLNSKARALEQQVLQYCRQSDLGEHVEVRTFEDDGAYVFNIIRSHHTRKPLAVVPGRSARATIQYRPVHCDILRYESSVGRLRVAARAATMIEFYRGVLGKVLFDDELFFDGDAVCNLGVLQERGRAALDNHGVFGIGQIRMTECLWERGDRNLVHFRSSDCFRSIEDLQLRLSEGTLLQAKLKVQVIGKSTRPVIVNIRVPSRIEISQKSHEPIIERTLQAIGIRNAAPTLAATDLWSLHPWRQPLAVWRTVFGPELDTLVQQVSWSRRNSMRYRIPTIRPPVVYLRLIRCLTEISMPLAGCRSFRRAP
jgi:Carbohydrate-binding module 48 (Isoamylase N-terminal domain)